MLNSRLSKNFLLAGKFDMLEKERKWEERRRQKAEKEEEEGRKWEQHLGCC